MAKPDEDKKAPKRKMPADTAAQRRRAELYRWAEQFARERGITEQDVLDAVRARRRGRR
jgi:hypothetical protein